jgi:hypothetical protein
MRLADPPTAASVAQAVDDPPGIRVSYEELRGLGEGLVGAGAMARLVKRLMAGS